MENSFESILRHCELDKTRFAELVSGSFSVQILIEKIRAAEDRGMLDEQEVSEIMKNIREIVLKMANIFYISSRAKSRRKNPESFM